MDVTEYWPWLVALGWLVAYELYAVIFRRRTLSQMVWRGTEQFPALPWIAIPIIGALVLHFWFGLWR